MVDKLSRNRRPLKLELFTTSFLGGGYGADSYSSVLLASIFLGVLNRLCIYLPCEPM